MNLKRHIVRAIVSWGSLLAFMMLFQPTKLPVAALIIPFLLLFAAFYSSWDLLGLIKDRYFGRGERSKLHTRLGMALCASAVFLLVLQSLGQLTLRDVATVLGIVWLGYIYLARTLSGSPRD